MTPPPSTEVSAEQDCPCWLDGVGAEEGVVLPRGPGDRGACEGDVGTSDTEDSREE